MIIKKKSSSTMRLNGCPLNRQKMRLSSNPLGAVGV